MLLAKIIVEIIGALKLHLCYIHIKDM